MPKQKTPAKPPFPDGLIPLNVQFPQGLTPLETVVVARCVNEDGDAEMYYDATPKLNQCEALGMLRWASLVIERFITEPDEVIDE